MLRGIAGELTGQHAAGTLAWKAPETFIGRYSPASDVFGLAVTWFEVLSRQQPFEGLTQPEIIENASARFKVQAAVLRFGISEERQREGWMEDNPLSARRPDLAAVEPGCPGELVALMQRCWADEVGERPAVEECVAELGQLLQSLSRLRALLSMLWRPLCSMGILWLWFMSRLWPT
jgi:DNA-binding helix-hairpin-helix protein with protein kinase domain